MAKIARQCPRAWHPGRGRSVPVPPSRFWTLLEASVLQQATTKIPGAEMPVTGTEPSETGPCTLEDILKHNSLQDFKGLQQNTELAACRRIRTMAGSIRELVARVHVGEGILSASQVGQGRKPLTEHAKILQALSKVLWSGGQSAEQSYSLGFFLEAGGRERGSHCSAKPARCMNSRSAAGCLVSAGAHQQRPRGEAVPAADSAAEPVRPRRVGHVHASLPRQLLKKAVHWHQARRRKAVLFCSRAMQRSRGQVQPCHSGPPP